VIVAYNNNRYWQTFNEFQNELQSFQEEFDSVEMKLANAKEQLDKLKVTNVYNDTFHIWHDGHFGTINSFRLGRLPSQPVDWNEINAAWGQATLLLHTIAKKLNFKFSQYEDEFSISLIVSLDIDYCQLEARPKWSALVTRVPMNCMALVI
jgi:hypothetical protein